MLPRSSNLALSASPICLTISPLFGAGTCPKFIVNYVKHLKIKIKQNSFKAPKFMPDENDELTLFHILAASLQALSPSS